MPDLKGFEPQNLALLANACSKWGKEPLCQRLVTAIAVHILTPAVNLQDFTEQHLANLSNALGILHACTTEETETLSVYQRVVSAIAGYLQAHPERLSTFDLLHISLLLRGFNRAELLTAIEALATPCLTLLAQYAQNNQEMQATRLESMGALCLALCPLLTKMPLRRYRSQVASLLEKLQPVIARKIHLWRRPPGHDGQTTEQYYTSRPALTFYQILKAYTRRHQWQTMLHSTLKEKKKNTAHQPTFSHWLKEIYSYLRDTADQKDFLVNGLPLIAELEAEDPLDTLDELAALYHHELQHSQGAARFDVDKVFKSLKQYPPQRPSGSARLPAIPVSDFRGRRLSSGERRYSILAELTQGAVQPVWVKLPLAMNPGLLTRTFHYQGIPYRCDVFGGSRMKPDCLDVASIVQGKNRFDLARQGQLLGIPLADTLPGSDFANLIRRLFPYRESFYYAQRALLSPPPGFSPKLDAYDHVLAGEFRTIIFPDRPAGQAHPFQVRNRQGQLLALRPHDGTGFLKQSLAEKMGWYAKAQQSGPWAGDQPNGRLPADALQHYPRNPAVTKEFMDKLPEKKPASRSSKEEMGALFYELTTAGACGYTVVAVPSADDAIHIPSSKIPRTGGGNLLLGRSPYDKPNLRPIDQAQVATSTREDPTARFLESCWCLQYSLVGQRPATLPTDRPGQLAPPVLC